MNIKDKLRSVASYVALTEQLLDAGRAYARDITKLCLCIVTAMILLMTNNVSSAVIDDIKADMQQLNEVTLLNARDGWFAGGSIQMGRMARGDASPTWWTPDNIAYKSTTPWDAIAPWFIIWPGEGNRAKNVRVKVYGITVYILEKSTGKWKKLDTGFLGNPTWAINFDFDFKKKTSDSFPEIEADGRLSYKLNAESNTIHGGIPKIDLTKYIAYPADVDAVYMSVKTELILDDPSGIDDRAAAQIALSAGADYYPTMTSTISDFSPMGYVPMAGSSRYGLVKTAPRTHYMSTIDPPGTGSNMSEYTQGSGNIAIPDYELAANMPPRDTIVPTAPTSLVLKKTMYPSYTSIILSWKASTDNVAMGGYYIYRDGKKIGVTTSTAFQDKLGNATGTVYKYVVKAFDAEDNLSSASNEISTVN